MASDFPTILTPSQHLADLEVEAAELPQHLAAATAAADLESVSVLKRRQAQLPSLIQQAARSVVESDLAALDREIASTREQIRRIASGRELAVAHEAALTHQRQDAVRAIERLDAERTRREHDLAAQQTRRQALASRLPE